MESRSQMPINSKFNASSTAENVIKGLNLLGKTAIITGGSSGLGLESTEVLANAGVNVIVGARNVSDAKEKLKSIPNVRVLPLDLADLKSVRNFANDIFYLNIKIDILICNAGVMACPESRVGPGWESQFATNHIGHYVLTNLVWKILNNKARIISVSSAGHHASSIRWNDIHFDKESYDKWVAYGQAKTANILFALQMDEYGKDYDIRSFSLHPGKILTPLQRHLGKEEMVEAGWIDRDGNVVDPEFKTPEQGAATQIWAATSPVLAGLGGLYCEDCNIAQLASTHSEPFRGVCDYAIDLAAAKKLWDFSAEITGVNAFGLSVSQ